MALRRSGRCDGPGVDGGRHGRRPSSRPRHNDGPPMSSHRPCGSRGPLSRSRSCSPNHDAAPPRGRCAQPCERRPEWRSDRAGGKGGSLRTRSPRGREAVREPQPCGRPPVASGTSRGGEPRALFLMGLPGAGKTTVKKRRLHRGDVDIEPDQFKRQHRRFSLDMGEETDDEVHRWSVRRSADALDETLMSPRKPNLVFDSSGSNAGWLGRRIDAARRAGYVTELLWVDVPVEVALLRNRDRAVLQGGRWCPEDVILDKAKMLSDSFEELRKEVDSAERLQNWSERGSERSVATEDLYIYPAPRTRPPSHRPGDKDYGEAPLGARSPSPTRGSMRNIRIAPWRRNDEVMRRKTARLAWMDRTYRGDREKYVLERVLKRRDVYLEPNRFPYHLPPGIEHWTIWSRKNFELDELSKYIEGWLDARKPHNVVGWNYDDNRGRRTIAVWHVHVYFQGADGQPPTIGESGHQRDDSVPKASMHRSPCSC